jgi:hypothetical protein
MKKLLLTTSIVLFSILTYSQTDTIFTKKKEKIACKITEIGEFDIRYRLAGLTDGPIYTVNRLSVVKYTLSNGFTEVIVPDELLLENEHRDIIANRSVIKIHPFSMVNNQFSFAYEKVIKVGMNLDIEAGFSNSNINPQTGLGVSNTIFNSGFYIKPGVKFFLGQDFSIRGLKYAHPLKGRYIKLDIAVSYLNYQNMRRFESTGTYPSVVTRTINSDMNVVSYGGFVNFGRQFILGNVLTLDYYAGMGFTGINYSYSNSSIVSGTQTTGRYLSGGNFIEGRYVSNFHGFLRTSFLGMSFTAGFRLGYIIPEKTTRTKSRKFE